MPHSTIVCARCTGENYPSSRFCVSCGLPLGSVEPDAEAADEALGPYEVPEPTDQDTARLVKELVERSGYEVSPASHGWRVVVPMEQERRQAVYVGQIGEDPEGRQIIAFVSVCGPANQRDTRSLLKLNAIAVEGHFAIKVLRGEEYFVVIENIAADEAPRIDVAGLVRRIAELADGLEDRLSRGRDLY